MNATDKLDELTASALALLAAMERLLGAAWPYIDATDREAAAAAIHAAGGSI